MGKRKPAAESTISFNITLPVKLSRRLDEELAKVKKLSPFMVVSRSQLISHALGEWVALLGDPTTEPTMPEVRARTRPTVERSDPNGSRLTPSMVRAIRKDRRTLDEIARDMGVNPTTVSRARSGATWAWVD